MLLPERPELMDNSVGDCLSVRLQEDMLMGRDRPYGSRLNAEADATVKKRANQVCYSAESLSLYLCCQPVPPVAGGGACMEPHRQPAPPRQIHPGTTARSPPGNRHQLQISASVLKSSTSYWFCVFALPPRVPWRIQEGAPEPLGQGPG